eukprot:scaffold1618_cov196-Alexandrium_tamarense.AAC.2
MRWRCLGEEAATTWTLVGLLVVKQREVERVEASVVPFSFFRVWVMSATTDGKKRDETRAGSRAEGAGEGLDMTPF